MLPATSMCAEAGPKRAGEAPRERCCRLAAMQATVVVALMVCLPVPCGTVRFKIPASICGRSMPCLLPTNSAVTSLILKGCLRARGVD